MCWDWVTGHTAVHALAQRMLHLSSNISQVAICLTDDHYTFHFCQACIFSADAREALSDPHTPHPILNHHCHTFSNLCRLAEGVNGDVIAKQLHEKLPSGCSLLPEQVEYVVLRVAKSMLQVCFPMYLTSLACPPRQTMSHILSACMQTFSAAATAFFASHIQCFL